MTKYNDGDQVTITHIGKVINSDRNYITIRTADNRAESFDLSRANSVVLNSHKKFVPGDVISPINTTEKYVVLQGSRVATIVNPTLRGGTIFNVDPNFLTSEYYAEVTV